MGTSLLIKAVHVVLSGAAGKPRQEDTPPLWRGQQPDHLYDPKHQHPPEDYKQSWQERLRQWT